VAIIPVNDLQAGMVLMNDATHSNGRVLLRGGVMLEDKHIKMFKAWGLVGADIEGITQEQMATAALDNADPLILESIRNELSIRFRHTDLTHPMLNMLHRLLLQQRVQQPTRDCPRAMDC
jgi:hypothetical protein